MIYTIGYQYLTPERLKEISRKLKAIVIDVRSNPRFRVKRGFSKSELESLLGSQYEWKGGLLGGRAMIQRAGLDYLDQFDNVEHNCILMCQEHDPSECHRHWDICSVHFRKALHIFEDDLYSVPSIDSDDPSPSGSI